MRPTTMAVSTAALVAVLVGMCSSLKPSEPRDQGARASAGGARPTQVAEVARQPTGKASITAKLPDGLRQQWAAELAAGIARIPLSAKGVPVTFGVRPTCSQGAFDDLGKTLASHQRLAIEADPIRCEGRNLGTWPRAIIERGVKSRPARIALPSTLASVEGCILRLSLCILEDQRDGCRAAGSSRIATRLAVASQGSLLVIERPESYANPDALVAALKAAGVGSTADTFEQIAGGHAPKGLVVATTSKGVTFALPAFDAKHCQLPQSLAGDARTTR